MLMALEGLPRAKPLKVAGPVAFAVGFHTTAMADRAAKRGAAERTGDREVTFRRPDYLSAVTEAWQLVEWTASENPEWLR